MKNQRIEIIKVEHHKPYPSGQYSGFTNHRIVLQQCDQGWTLETFRMKDPVLIFQDLHAVRAHCMFGKSLACPFLSSAYADLLSKI